MSATNLLRKAKPVNVRAAQAQRSKLIRSKSPSMVLSHGKPGSFLVPDEDMLDLIESLDKLKDKKLLRARMEYTQGKAVPAERLFKKLGYSLGWEVVSPSERVERAFQKTLTKIPSDYQDAIVIAIRSLAANPRPEGKRTKQLTGQIILSQLTAEYRLRVRPCRVLYDIDDQKKKVILLKLAKRDEWTDK